MKKPLSDEDFVAIYSRVPRLNVELIVRTGQGILLTKRAIEPWKGKWHVPGGTVHYGETFDDAIKRISLDELGTGVVSTKPVGYMEYLSSKNLDVFTGWPLGVAFIVELAGSDIYLNEDAESLRYFNSLPDDLIVDQRVLLERVLRGEV